MRGLWGGRHGKMRGSAAGSWEGRGRNADRTEKREVMATGELNERRKGDREGSQAEKAYETDSKPKDERCEIRSERPKAYCHTEDEKKLRIGVTKKIQL